MRSNAEYREPAWYWYTAHKLAVAADAMEKADCDYFVFSDCDIIFFKNKKGWESLFEWFSKQGYPVAYMRDHASNVANSGLYIIKRDYLGPMAQLNRLLHKMATRENLEYGDQTALNFMRPIIRNTLIPREYTFSAQNLAGEYLVFYHGVGGGLGTTPVQMGGRPDAKFYHSKMGNLESHLKAGRQILGQKV